MADLSSSPDVGASPDAFDYGTDGEMDQEAVARARVELDRLARLAESTVAARKRLEDQLQAIKRREERLLQKDIPELLVRMGLKECTTASGIQIKIKHDVRVSLPALERAEARQGALRWLVEQGHGEVIKNLVSVALDRGNDARADELIVELRARGLAVESKKDVHVQTLGALVRELMEDGKIVPRHLFNLFDQRVAQLSRKQ
jgi:hypothetical protein